LIILVIALWLVRLPFAYGFVDRLGADAIWWSFPLGSIVSLTLSTLYYRFGNWRSAKMLPSASPPPPPEAAQAAIEPSATGS
jgi:Na+-driven multidrug efflux pump